LGQQLQTLAATVENTIDVLARVVGCDVDDVYASQFKDDTA
jgi:hypothetical protein